MKKKKAKKQVKKVDKLGFVTPVTPTYKFHCVGEDGLEVEIEDGDVMLRLTDVSTDANDIEPKSVFLNSYSSLRLLKLLKSKEAELIADYNERYK